MDLGFFLKRKFFFVLAGLLAGALLAGGCGSGDDSGAAGAPAPGTASQGPDGEGDGESRGDGAAGEGGAGEGSAGGSGSIAATEFAEEADEICRKRRGELFAQVALYVRGSSDSGKSEAALQAEAVDSLLVRNREAELRELRELAVPAGNEAEVERFLAALEEGIQATRRKEFTAANIDDFGSEYGRANRLGERYGMLNCTF